MSDLEIRHSLPADTFGLRRAILGLSLLGFLFFAGALALSFLDPLLIERAAREVIRMEVERRVGAKIESLSGSRLAGVARRALQGTDLEIAQTAEKSRLSSLAQARVQLAGLIESAYSSVTASLLREFRIFTASNAAAFALLGGVAFFRGKAALQLLLPAVALVGAVAVAAGLYMFAQNWLHTILFGDYVGWGYAVYMAVVATMLADVIYNRARVTTNLVNLVLAALGSATLAVPC